MSSKKRRAIENFVPEWIWEVLLIAVVTPAIVQGLITLGGAPIV